MKVQFFMENQLAKLFITATVVTMLTYNANAQDAATPTPAAEKSAIAVYNEGLAAMKEKNYKNAFMSLESAYNMAKIDNNVEVLDLAKKNVVPAAYYYGNDLLKLKSYAEALGIFNKGLAIDPSASLLQQSIGKTKEESGDLDGAVTSYFGILDAAKTEKDDKKVADIQGRFKNILIKQLNAKAYAKVIKIGSDYLVKDKNADISYLVGKAHADKGDAVNGVKYMLESVDQTTAAGAKVDDKVYYGLGLAYELRKDNKSAIKYLSMITDAKYKANAQAIITKLSAAK